MASRLDDRVAYARQGPRTASSVALCASSARTHPGSVNGSRVRESRQAPRMRAEVGSPSPVHHTPSK